MEFTTKISSYLHEFKEYYHEIFYTKADPRIRDRFLMGDPSKLVIIYITYVFIIQVILKKFMKNRPPFRLRNFENFVSLIFFAISAFFFFTTGCYFWFNNYNWRCEPFDRSESELAMLSVNLCHLYLMSKFFYTLDSVILVLRKNATYMEHYLLVHHTLLPFAVWSVINYFPTGHAVFLGIVNSFAHLLLFGYQLIANNFFLKKKLYRYIGLVSQVLLCFQIMIFTPHTLQLYFSNKCNFPMEYPAICLIWISIAIIVALLFILPKIIKTRRMVRKMQEHLNESHKFGGLDLETFDYEN